MVPAGNGTAMAPRFCNGTLMNVPPGGSNLIRVNNKWVGVTEHHEEGGRHVVRKL
jgi:hypothetical protein